MVGEGQRLVAVQYVRACSFYVVSGEYAAVSVYARVRSASSISAYVRGETVLETPLNTFGYVGRSTNAIRYGRARTESSVSGDTARNNENEAARNERTKSSPS